MLSLLRRIWLDGRLYVANSIVAHIPFHCVRLQFYRTVMKVKIGRGSSIFMGAWLDTPGGLVIGNNSTINQKCRMDSRGGLYIGNNVSISAEVCILTAEHDIQSPDFAGVQDHVRIEDYVFVGTRALILPGVTLGTGAVVAAGAVVTKSVEPYVVVGGVPARILGKRNAALEYEVFYRRFYQ
jgi:acetyltransferase-like isoleucine patch superfamily enzyme